MKTTKGQRAQWRAKEVLLAVPREAGSVGHAYEFHIVDLLDDLDETLAKLKVKERELSAAKAELAGRPRPSNEEVEARLDGLRKAMGGDPLGVGRDPEMWAAAIASAYTSYRSATSDPNATLRFTEVRDDWLKVLDSLVKYDGLSAFNRYYCITEWLFVERKRIGALGQDDEADVAERLDDLWEKLYEPERTAIESAIETLKKRHASST